MGRAAVPSGASTGGRSTRSSTGVSGSPVSSTTPASPPVAANACCTTSESCFANKSGPPSPPERRRAPRPDCFLSRMAVSSLLPAFYVCPPGMNSPNPKWHEWPSAGTGSATGSANSISKNMPTRRSFSRPPLLPGRCTETFAVSLRIGSSLSGVLTISHSVWPSCGLRPGGERRRISPAVVIPAA